MCVMTFWGYFGAIVKSPFDYSHIQLGNSNHSSGMILYLNSCVFVFVFGFAFHIWLA